MDSGKSSRRTRQPRQNGATEREDASAHFLFLLLNDTLGHLYRVQVTVLRVVKSKAEAASDKSLLAGGDSLQNPSDARLHLARGAISENRHWLALIPDLHSG